MSFPSRSSIYGVTTHLGHSIRCPKVTSFWWRTLGCGDLTFAVPSLAFCMKLCSRWLSLFLNDESGPNDFLGICSHCGAKFHTSIHWSRSTSDRECAPINAACTSAYHNRVLSSWISHTLRSAEHNTTDEWIMFRGRSFCNSCHWPHEVSLYLVS